MTSVEEKTTETPEGRAAAAPAERGGVMPQAGVRGRFRGDDGRSKAEVIVHCRRSRRADTMPQATRIPVVYESDSPHRHHERIEK